MNGSQLLTVAAAGALLIASRRTSVGVAEAAPGDFGTIDPSGFLDEVERFWNMATEQPAAVDDDTAARNLAAFLRMLQMSEGTASQPDPYRVCYGYGHTVQSMGAHPAESGEWRGERLPDAMCINAGLRPGCVSTAAGAYQIIKPTWERLRKRLGLVDFTAASQDAAAAELIRSRGALEHVKAGRLAQALRACAPEWASLPGNYAKQGQRDAETLAAWYTTAGGMTA